MAKLGVAAAAQAAGVSRHTIWRYAKSGKLSSEIAPTGERVLDTAELARVFGDLHHAATLQQRLPCTVLQPLEPTTSVAVLQQQIEQQQAEIERLRTERDAERAERRALQDRYLTIIERLQLTGPAKPVAVPRSRPKPDTVPSRAPSTLETLAGSVAGWLNGSGARR